jgi:ATP-dependent DNA helicase RecQ
MPWPCGWSARASPDATGAGDENFAAAIDEIRRQAIGLLRATNCRRSRPTRGQRDRLLGGFRWILVDEYQDIGPQQYELIGALAGRSLRDEDTRLNLFAVGDDDQNIYAFSGASVEFIRRFEADYAARAVHLVDNYRATAHLIDAANRLIAPAANRMKAAQPIRIDRARRQQPPGGDWAKIDPVARAASRSCRSAAMLARRQWPCSASCSAWPA